MTTSGDTATAGLAGASEEIIDRAAERASEGEQDGRFADAPRVFDEGNGGLTDAGDAGELGLVEPERLAASGDGGGEIPGVGGIHHSALCLNYSNPAIPTVIDDARHAPPSFTPAWVGLILSPDTSRPLWDGGSLLAGKPMPNSRRMPNGRHEYFCEQVKRRRLALGYSQTKLASLSGVSQSTISRIESKDPRRADWQTIASLAKALECAPDDLTGSHLAERPAAGEPPGAPRAQATPRAATVGRVHSSELLRDYVLSDWMQQDQPTAEELRWLDSLGHIAWVGEPPTAAAMHAFLMDRRAGKI